MAVSFLSGDCRDILPTLGAGIFDCVVTSPPYWGLRDYGTAQWAGGDANCAHIGPPIMSAKTGLSHPERKSREHLLAEPYRNVGIPYREVCGKCGARRIDRQIGLEPTLDGYVETMRGVGRELWRVLKPSGTFWLNLGDGYAGDGGFSPNAPSSKSSKSGVYGNLGALKPGGIKPAGGLKPKDLCGVPWRVAFALQADGWWLRSEVIWAKPNGMPGSQADRCTSSHETIFLLTKSANYWSDFDAIKTPPRESSLIRLAQDVQAQAGSHRANGGEKTNGPMKAVAARDKQRGHSRRHHGFNERWDAMGKMQQQSSPAMMRDVWFVPPEANRLAHFAIMPSEIARRCILAGCPEGGHVLDPFGGAGTTGLVADRLGRDATLIDLNPDYRKMGADRIVADAPLFVNISG